jgi:4-amino-4-deoxy-L-arabinose transferase-like glycosyltransferase
MFAAAGLALRLAFFWKLSFIQGDSFIYGDIARNLLQHHQFARTDDGLPVPTLIRLPGYPFFLALIWLFAGVEHYHAVIFAQIAIDLGTCLVVGALAYELSEASIRESAARGAFVLAALCPFLANYATTPLSETLAVFFAALTFYCATKACANRDDLRWWMGCGAAVAASILLRPDGGLLLATLGLYFFVRLLRSREKRRVFIAGTLVALVSLAPLVPWTLRNWEVMHVVQPLAPRYANDPDEFVMHGYIRWLKTWVVDYASVEDLDWPVPGDPIDPEKLPDRAFDSPEQREHTQALLDAYNQELRITLELDQQFAELAEQRVRAHPLRYYVLLPAARVADMWLRPRTEALPIESHWWDYENDPRDYKIAAALAVLNLLYLSCALAGVVTRRVRMAGLLLTWILLRSAFLGTLENPETRYTLECFPLVVVFAAVWLAGWKRSATAS